MVSFEIFVKSMPLSLSKLKVIPSFCFAFKIPDNMTATMIFSGMGKSFPLFEHIAGQDFAFRQSLFFSAKKKEKCVIFSPYTMAVLGLCHK